MTTRKAKRKDSETESAPITIFGMKLWQFVLLIVVLKQVLPLIDDIADLIVRSWF